MSIVSIGSLIWAHFLRSTAKNRALRGSALGHLWWHRSGLSTPRCFVPRLNPSNPLRTNRERIREQIDVAPRPVGLDLCKTVFRGSPCCLVSNNALTVSRAALGAPVGLEPCKTGIRGSPCCLESNNTLNVSRAALGAPVGLEPCKTVFRGSPCCLDTTTRSPVRVRPWVPPLNFAKQNPRYKRGGHLLDRRLSGCD
jgi:hypothetical protein